MYSKQVPYVIRTKLKAYCKFKCTSPIPPKYRRFTVQSTHDYVDAIVSPLKKIRRGRNLALVLATIHEERL